MVAIPTSIASVLAHAHPSSTASSSSSSSPPPHTAALTATTTDIRIESLHPDKSLFPTIGHRLPRASCLSSQLTVPQTKEHIRYTNDELKRWERSIAFVHEGELPSMSETETLQDMLHVLYSIMTPALCAPTLPVLEATLAPLRPWAACVVRTEEAHEALYHAVSQALFSITAFLLESTPLGSPELDQSEDAAAAEAGTGQDTEAQRARRKHKENHEYVKSCHELSGGYIATREQVAGIERELALAGGVGGGSAELERALSSDSLARATSERKRKRDMLLALSKRVKGTITLQSRMGSPPRFA